jgi:hypothetical protein
MKSGHAEKTRHGRTVQIGVQKADRKPLPGPREGQSGRNAGFPHSALSAGDGQDEFDAGEILRKAGGVILNLLQNAGTAVAGDVVVGLHKEPGRIPPRAGRTKLGLFFQDRGG